MCSPDSIENNIDRAGSHVEEGRQQLEKAASHQVITAFFFFPSIDHFYIVLI